MKTESRTHRTGPVRMKDETGQEYDVYCEAEEERTQFLDNSWSNWVSPSQRYFTANSHVNPPGEDGWWVVVATGVRIRP